MMPHSVPVDFLITAIGVLLSALMAFFAVKFGLQQVVKDVAELKGKTEAKDADHDDKLADHDKRLAVLESKFDTVIRNMQGQIKDIYDKLVGG